MARAVETTNRNRRRAANRTPMTSASSPDPITERNRGLDVRELLCAIRRTLDLIRQPQDDLLTIRLRGGTAEMMGGRTAPARLGRRSSARGQIREALFARHSPKCGIRSGVVSGNRTPSVKARTVEDAKERGDG
jgi:hypothetical protein